MKKTVYLSLLMLCATVALLFAGCDLLEEPFPEFTNNETIVRYPATSVESSIQIDPEKTQPETVPETADPYAGLSEEERQIREISDAALLVVYDLPAWEHFDIEISYGVNGVTDIFVRYEFMIYGYRTYESYSVTLNADRTVKNLYGSHEGKYSRYLATVTEEAFRAAEREIGNGGYLSIDDEGWLCLSREDIVPITPETDENGNEIMEGCGDHIHEFYHERICPKP